MSEITHPDDETFSTALVVTTSPPRKAGRPKGSGKGVSVRKVAGRVKAAKSTTLALTHKLLSGAADKVVAEIIRKAMDPADRDQKDMLKLCFDRIAPIAAFERANASQMNRVEVIVTLAAEPQTQGTTIEMGKGTGPIQGDVIDVEARVVQSPRDNKTDEEDDLPTPEGDSDELPG